MRRRRRHRAPQDIEVTGHVHVQVRQRPALKACRARRGHMQSVRIVMQKGAEFGFEVTTLLQERPSPLDPFPTRGRAHQAQLHRIRLKEGRRQQSGLPLIGRGAEKLVAASVSSSGVASAASAMASTLATRTIMTTTSP